jgi:hypothetical protein
MMTATVNYRGPEVFDQVKQSNPTLAWITRDGRIDPWDGGADIEIPVRIGMNDSFAARDYKEQIVFGEQDPLDFVTLPARGISGNIMWYNRQAEENERAGKQRILAFTNKLIDDARDAAQSRLGLEIWQDGSGEHLHGIGSFLENANTYMGIDRTVAGNEYWKAKTTDAVVDTTGFTITWPDGTTQACGPYHTAESLVLAGGTDGGLTTIYDDLCDNGGTDGPDFGLTTPALFRKLILLAKAEGILGYSEKLKNLGYPENLQFRNAAITWDRNCTAARFIFINSNHLSLRPSAGYDKTFKASPVIDLASDGIRGKAVIMEWWGNLCATKPGKHGALDGKTVA